MSSFTERATWTENPFVFMNNEPLPSGVPIDIETIPLHKALYDKLAKLVIPSPRSKTDPWSDKGRREWRPGYDPVTKLDPTTVAPGLVEGMPLQSRRRKEPQGEGGKATFLGLLHLPVLIALTMCAFIPSSDVSSLKTAQLNNSFSPKFLNFSLDLLNIS